jgi:hypothetical protein
MHSDYSDSAERRGSCPHLAGKLGTQVGLVTLFQLELPENRHRLSPLLHGTAIIPNSCTSAAGSRATKVGENRRDVSLFWAYSEGMSKRKNKEPSQPPEPPLRQVLNDFMIDMKVAELRNTVSMLEGRISDLLGQKGNPPSLGDGG